MQSDTIPAQSYSQNPCSRGHTVHAPLCRLWGAADPARSLPRASHPSRGGAWTLSRWYTLGWSTALHTLRPGVTRERTTGAVGGAILPVCPGRCCGWHGQERLPSRGSSAETRTPTTISLANAVIRAGFLRHPGGIAAGGLLLRTPHAPVRRCLGSAGSSWAL